MAEGAKLSALRCAFVNFSDHPPSALSSLARRTLNQSETGVQPLLGDHIGTQPAISYVVVTHNSAADIQHCIESIFRQDVVPTEVVIVDSASTDETLEIVRTMGSNVRLMAISENVGYGTANNRGALCAKGDFIAIVNPDVVLDGRWARELVGALAIEPKCAAAEGKLLVARRRNTLNCCGSYANVLGFGCARGNGQPDNREISTHNVSYPS